MVQQMIVSAFTVLGLQGIIPTSATWLVDSTASNHMTDSTTDLHDVHEYDGTQSIQIANGSTLPITAVGDLGPSFKDVFVSPELSTSLISVGQLVDDNCDVHFSHGDCIVQDQVSGMVIAKGPKVGRLFQYIFLSLMLFLLLVWLLPITMKYGIRNWVILILLS